MEVSLETTGTISRRMTVRVPASELDRRVEERLRHLARTVRIPGFRPGKVPRKVVAARFQGQVLNEVAQELIGTSYREALDKEQVVPAGRPTIEPKSLERGQDLEFIADFDVFPSIPRLDIKGETIERPACRVEDEDVDRTIDSLRRRQTRWQPAERGAQEGDRVTIDFTGTIDGEPFDGGSASGYAVVLGSGSLVSEIEEGLKGARDGDERDIEVTFPDDYPGVAVAGKRASFAIKVKEVALPVLPEIDEEFVRGFGVEDGTGESLRREVRENLERELADRMQSTLRSQVLEKLLAGNEFEVPRQLVEEEIDSAIEQVRGQLRQQGMPADGEIDRGRYETEARRRVALGLIIGELVKSRGISVDEGDLRARLERVAASYEDPREFIDWHFADRSRLAHLQAVVLEEKVVDALLAEAEIVDKATTFKDFVGQGEGGG
jgi:trigger factor